MHFRSTWRSITIPPGRMSGCVGDPRGCNWMVVRTSGKLACDVQAHRHRLGSAVSSNNSYMKVICANESGHFLLPITHSLLPTTRDTMARPRSWSMKSDSNAHSRQKEKAHLSNLRQKGPLGWHTSSPKRGPKSLALKNGESYLRIVIDIH